LCIRAVIICPAIGGGVFRVLGNVALTHAGDSITTKVNHLHMREAVKTWKSSVTEMFGSLLARWHQHYERPNWRINLQKSRDNRFS
jgi:hypothetical protein